MVKFCSNCRKILPITTKKCPLCDNSNLSRFCTECKKFVPDGARVCPTCGDTKILDQKSISKQEHKPNKGAAIAMFAVIVIIAGMYGAGYIWKTFLAPCRNGHTWGGEATCTEPEICLVCGEEGLPLGHDWEGATCTTPGICSRCGEEGNTASHRYSYGACEICGTEEEFYYVTEESDDDFWYAITAAKDLVKEQLTAPSTAEFPSSASEYIVRRAIPPEGDWIVTSYVDSQNGFGAMLRTKWVASFYLGPEYNGKRKIENDLVLFP